MPIRPENRARYPKNWREISKRIRFERAKGRCECTGECGDNHFGDGLVDDRCLEYDGEEHSITGSKVVLTVAHLNHTPEDCRDENLKAMCQRCHNKLDAPMRRAGIKARAFAASAIGDLFDSDKGA